MVSLKTHNILDYILGVVLIAMPYIWGLNEYEAVRYTFLYSGFGLISYSLLTNYKYSLYKVIPVRTHMALDALIGVFIMSAPSLFQYKSILTEGQYVTHFVLGFGAIGLVAVTRFRPQLTHMDHRHAPLTR